MKKTYDSKKCKRGVQQMYGKPQKKESNRNPGNKKSLKSKKTPKQSVRPLHHTTTCGRQNLRAQRKK
jgi:hypothetical protein